VSSTGDSAGWVSRASEERSSSTPSGAVESPASELPQLAIPMDNTTAVAMAIRCMTGSSSQTRYFTVAFSSCQACSIAIGSSSRTNSPYSLPPSLRITPTLSWPLTSESAVAVRISRSFV
jgi:hypothetical protein